VILSDSLLYLGSMANVNVDAPKAGCPSGTDRRALRRGGHARDHSPGEHLVGDPSGPIREVDAVMLAGRDINLMQYAASAATCCDGVTNDLTFKGSVLALRGTALARDWADPTPGTKMPTAMPRSRVPTRHVHRGRHELWRGGRLLAVPQQGSCDRTLRRRYGPERVSGLRDTQTQPHCLSGSRRVTHFALTINYDKRLQENPELVPPGLPTRGLATLVWKDCGSNPNCP
jgi:hypothetical protein